MTTVMGIEKIYEFKFSNQLRLYDKNGNGLGSGGNGVSEVKSLIIPYEWTYDSKNWEDELQGVITIIEYQIISEHIKYIIGLPHYSFLKLIILILTTYILPSILILKRIFNTPATIFIILGLSLSVSIIPFLYILTILRSLKKKRNISQNLKMRNINFKYSFKLSKFNIGLIVYFLNHFIVEIVSYLNDNMVVAYILFAFIIIDLVIVLFLSKFFMLFSRYRGLVSSYSESDHISSLDEICSTIRNPLPFYLSYPENIDFINTGHFEE